jgi:glycerol-3-phosphate cytidylyltransferase-like family protein
MADNSATIFHSNRYNAQAACKHCEGVIRHEPWCITLHPTVYYAYQIVADPSKLTMGDALILRSLGVIWEANACQGNCQRNKTSQSSDQA